MKNARNQDKKLGLLATLLLLLAIPISLLGVNQVNDIRNRAEEEKPLISFLSDFTSEDFTQAYSSIPYMQMVEVDGEFAPLAMITLGCDTTVCGNMCASASNNPPDGFGLAEDGKTLYWEHPSPQDGRSSWPITVTAMVPNDDPEAETDYVCATQSFELTYSAESPAAPPSCSLHTSQSLGAVPQGSTSPLILEGADPGSGISSAMIRLTPDEGSPYLYEWDFPDTPESILLNDDSAPELRDLPQDLGQYDIYGSVTDVDGTTAECDSPTESQLMIVIPGDNGSPVFETDPYTDSRPGTSINVGASYTYTVEASDPNGDSIDFYVINNTGWLTFTENNSSSGSFKGTFSGTPTAPGSYTAVIALNDGFHDHYSTQLWVINVNSEENDTPVVTVEEPAAGTVFQQNEQTTVRWSVSDSNLVTRFDVYVTQDPTQRSAWTELQSNLAYNYDSYVWHIGNLAKGTYYLVVEATDNQDPPGIGTGVSGAIGIGVTPTEPSPEEPEQEEEEEPPDIVSSYPVVSNILPENQSETDDATPLISADLAASDGETIDTASVKVMLDDEDITGITILNRGGEPEGSLMYTPGQPLATGSHKVSVTFKDTAEKTATKQWTFTIVAPEPEEEPEEDSDTITILGVTVPKRTAYIVGIGLSLFILALLIPWLLFAAWRRTRDEDSGVDDRLYGGTLPPTPGTGNISSIAAQPSPAVKPPAEQAPPPPSTKPVPAPEPSPKPPIVPADSFQDTEPEPVPAPLPSAEPKPIEPSPQPPLTPGPDETKSSTNEPAGSSPQPPSYPEPASSPASSTGTEEPSEEELVAALQQIAKEEAQKIPEDLRPKEPRPKDGASSPDISAKPAGKPPLKPSDLSNLMKNGESTEDPDPDDYTIA